MHGHFGALLIFQVVSRTSHLNSWLSLRVVSVHSLVCRLLKSYQNTTHAPQAMHLRALAWHFLQVLTLLELPGCPPPTIRDQLDRVASTLQDTRTSIQTIQVFLSYTFCPRAFQNAVQFVHQQRVDRKTKQTTETSSSECWKGAVILQTYCLCSVVCCLPCRCAFLCPGTNSFVWFFWQLLLLCQCHCSNRSVTVVSSCNHWGLILQYIFLDCESMIVFLPGVTVLCFTNNSRTPSSQNNGNTSVAEASQPQ